MDNVTGEFVVLTIDRKVQATEMNCSEVTKRVKISDTVSDDGPSAVRMPFLMTFLPVEQVAEVTLCTITQLRVQSTELWSY